MESNKNTTNFATATWTNFAGVSRTLTYTKKDAKFLIAIGSLGADQDNDCGYFYSFDTIEEARRCWKLTVSEWRNKGFVPANEYWADVQAKLAHGSARRPIGNRANLVPTPDWANANPEARSYRRFRR